MKKLLAGGTLVFAATSSFAQFTYATSFEAPSWSTASSNPFLANSWDRPSGSAAQFSLVGPSSSPAGVAFTGTQSVRFNLTTGNVTNYSVNSPSGISALWPATNKGLRITSKLYIEGATSGAGRYFGVGLGGLMKIVVNENGSVKTTSTSGIFGSDQTGPAVNDRWIDVSLTLDYIAGTAYGSVDGRNFSLGSIGTSGTVNTFVLWSRGDNNTGGSGSGRAYWDDVQVTPVPEPATMAVLSLGALGLLRRRKNS